MIWARHTFRPNPRPHCLDTERKFPEKVCNRLLSSLGSAPLASASTQQCRARVLIADDEPGIRLACRYALELEGLYCDEAEDGLRALDAVRASRHDLVLLDIHMPGMRGTDVCRELRADFLSPELKIILISGDCAPDDLVTMMLDGADDVISKPFSVTQLQARVKAALRHKEAEDRSDRFSRTLISINSELEEHLLSCESDLAQAQNALVLALTKLTECRDDDTGGHLLRIQRFSMALAEEARRSSPFSSLIDEGFIEQLGGCAPLHDVGKVGLPDHILRKPGALTADERLIMQTHTLIGYNTLKAVADQNEFAHPVLAMAMDVARHHHERYDGCGYPDRFVGNAIPLAARLVALCDVYDALRSPRVYKAAIPHEEVVQRITDGSPGQFDPALLPVFRRCAHRFERIYAELTPAR
jgi:response regulator RpfG family c-di-GMP phosphodiesterase